MSATLKIDHDPIDNFVTVVFDCEHGTSTVACAQGDAVSMPYEMLTLWALADHCDNQPCDCTRSLWEKYGRNWKRLGLPMPPFFAEGGSQ